MKVKELIELLKKLDPESMVLLSSDEEGNNFSPMYDFGTGNFEKDSESDYPVLEYSWSIKKEDAHGNYVVLYPC